MLDALVDERGQLLSATPPIRRDAGAPEPIDDHIARAIWEDGYVYLQTVGPSLVVACRPCLVRRETLIGAFREMCERRPREIMLSHTTGLRSAERFDHIEAAMYRIEQLAREAQEIKPRGLAATRLALDAVENIQGGILVGLLGAWYETGRRWSPEFYERLKDAALLGNAVIIRKPAHSEELLIEHWGEQRDLFGPEWVRTARGRRVEEQPYSSLARWVSRLFRDAIASNEARLDAVKVAIIAESGEQRMKQYSRLLLPWRGEESETYALTVNVPDLPRAVNKSRARKH
jgi:hypothetical protein